MPGPEEAGPSRQRKRKRADEVTPSAPLSKRAPFAGSRASTGPSSPSEGETLETDGSLPCESASTDGDEDIGMDDDDLDRRLPVRMLNNFCIYEEYDGKRIIQPIDCYDSGSTTLYAVGFASPYFVDADISDEDLSENTSTLLRTTPIRDLYVQYLEYDRLIWIQTDHAWYVLCEPSIEYSGEYNKVAKKHISLQLLCSLAADSKTTLEQFHDALEREVLGRAYRTSDLLDFMNILNKFAHEEGQSILHIPLIRAVRQECGADKDMLPPPSAPRARKRRPAIYNDSPHSFNLDEHVLRPDQLSRTCMTPFIDRLRGRYHPSWAVDGNVVDWAHGDGDIPEPSAERKEAEHEHLLECVRRARDDVDDGVRVHRRNDDDDVTAVRVGSEIYHVGDVVVFFPTSSWNGKQPSPLPKHDEEIAVGTRLEDLGFWFGTLVSIEEPPEPPEPKAKSKSKSGRRQDPVHPVIWLGHIVWFEHACRTFVGAEADPRELTRWPRQCSDESLAAIHGKVGVHMMYEPGIIADIPSNCSYFCRFEYSEELGYRSLARPPPFDTLACSNCSVKDMRALDDDDKPLKIDRGFRIHGELYHVDDFCFYSPDEASLSDGLDLARIGQIATFDVKQGRLELREFGRIAEYASILCDHGIERYWDDRQLFAGPFIRAQFEHIVGPCQVIHRDDIVKRTPYADLRSYISASSLHFWFLYASGGEALDVTSVDDLEEVKIGDVDVCDPCAKEFADREDKRGDFCAIKQGRKCLDLCAGTCMLAKGLSEGSRGIYRTTHAVEIRPSAAQTIRDSHPQTKVYMTCLNPLLQASVQWCNGDKESYCSLKATDGSGLPDIPPQPEDDIDTIVGGIPCQPHSGLNAFKRQRDKKADLMLSFLSWVHFIRPNRVILENVKGFMKFAVDGVSTDEKASRGSGLRFLVNVLMRLGYQVQFCLLNAVHYGAPQRRVRFILFAAKIGIPLMHAPRPTHYHPSEAAHLTYGHLNAEGQDVKLSAHDARHYCVPLRYVSIEDAIGDLMPWDLEFPDPRIEVNRALDEEELVRFRDHLAAIRGDIPEYPQLDTEEGMVGPQDDIYINADLYTGPPHSIFQEMMRPEDKEVHELQHYSIKLGKNMTRLMLLVPLAPLADWQSIPDGWVDRLADPSRRSKDWKNGTIGRVDKEGVFQTIVTNIHPLAKQGWVLHPYCRRMLSIRELARAQGIPDWFHIYAPVDERHGVITRSGVIEMHRQIGNAVPLPLAIAIGRAMLDAEFEPWYALPEHERWSEFD